MEHKHNQFPLQQVFNKIQILLPRNEIQNENKNRIKATKSQSENNQQMCKIQRVDAPEHHVISSRQMRNEIEKFYSSHSDKIMLF